MEGRLTESERVLEELEQAHRNWEIAMEQFNNAVGDDVVDDAIYLLLAAEMRYEGLLRIARRMGIGVDMKGRIVEGEAPVRLAMPTKPSAAPSQAPGSPPASPQSQPDPAPLSSQTSTRQM